MSVLRSQKHQTVFFKSHIVSFDTKALSKSHKMYQSSLKIIQIIKQYIGAITISHFKALEWLSEESEAK